jgi:hypothetical protein
MADLMNDDLFEDEDIRFDDLDEVPSALTDERINEKYARGEVRIVTEQARYPLATVAKLFGSSEYQMNPEFQRRHRWSAHQQSKLIESFIMNVPVPPVFLYEDSFSHYEVMDGLQRVTAIVKLYVNELTLEGLEEWPELNGRRYSELPDQVKRGIDRRYLSSIILLHETARTEPEAHRLKRLVFERLNSGGVKLQAQESRNALLNGPMNQLCIKLGRNANLCRTWGIPEPDEGEVATGEPSARLLQNASYATMEDAEMVLRFFAFRQKRRTGSLKDFLDAYLRAANRFTPKLLGQLRDHFEATIELAADIFGNRAFLISRKRRDSQEWVWLQRPTKMVYDPLMLALGKNLAAREQLIACADRVRTEVHELYKSKAGAFEGVYRNTGDVESRATLFEQAIARALAA